MEGSVKNGGYSQDKNLKSLLAFFEKFGQGPGFKSLKNLETLLNKKYQENLCFSGI